MSNRVPINIDRNVRTALRRHLMSPQYMGTGVGFSEFIHRAIAADGGDPGPAVQPDNRWTHLSETCNEEDHASVTFEAERGHRVRRLDCIDCAREREED